ncbi:MAG TPA: GNAT family N-acetyltransferase, partial [Anaerolineae bacterium]|nr:GNAT family N-acetyltransferase [Anaerolineae bacterium]
PNTLDQLSIAPELLGELKCGAEYSLIAATFVDKQPVSFCYVASETESLWDISIDTLSGSRRKGYAALCVAHMIRHMQAQGKQPVWQAVEENPASWRLAQKLGFVPVDELALFEPHEQASSLHS